MKSQEELVLLNVVQGICKDVVAAYPALKGFCQDIDRLSLYCQTRGLAFFTLDLPNLDSMLVSGLEDGRLRLSGPLSRRVSKRVKVPRFFSGLWLRVFDKDACLKQDVDINAIFFLRQLCCFGKKVEVECSYDRQQATIKAYYDVERGLRKPTLEWDSDTPDFGEGSKRRHLGEACPVRLPVCALDLQGSERTLQEEDTTVKDDGLRRLLEQCQQVADLVALELGEFCPIAFSGERDMANRGTGFRHGPGAVAERLRNHEKSSFPNWPAKLQAVFPFELIGKMIGSEDLRPLNHEVASRLLCVPKTAKSPRLIAAEPTAHQYCQQGIRFWMDDRLRDTFIRHFVDFSKQSKSGDLVLQSSLDRKLATVDLSDASDRLSCWTVERMFRANSSLLTALHAARTRYVRDEISGELNFFKTKKFASQGTANTFPVLSLVCFIIAMGCSLDGEVTLDSIRKMRNQVRVYGDDIIVPVYGYERLVRVMDALQLKVNTRKSFVRGHFRESCGVDGYMGHDVTPAKPKTVTSDSPASRQAVVDTSNNLFNKGLWHASLSLSAHLPPHLQRGMRIVGINDAGYPGFTSFVGSDESHLRKRWNSRLHRTEVRVWAPVAQTQERSREGWSTLLDFVSSKHNHEHARIASKYVRQRKTRDGFLWEPSSHHAHRTTA